MITCASFFAGVGGIDLGFEQTNKYKVIYANELDIYPIKTYELNHSIKVDNRSICDVKGKDVPDCDIYLAGFPCTDISLAGLRQGLFNEDGSLTRSGLFFELIRIIHEKKKKPRVIFLENVKNLVSHNNGETYQTIIEALKNEGYSYIKAQVLNACEYGNIPQNRERIYILAFRTKKDKEKFDFPNPIPLTVKLEDIIDFNNIVDEKYYYTKGKYSNNLYEKLEEGMDESKSIYQWRRQYVRKNKSGLIPTLTANQGTGGHNVCLIRTNNKTIRKMTPHECFNAQGFPITFQLPNDISDARLYKQAGNSVCVSVIKRIAESLLNIF